MAQARIILTQLGLNSDEIDSLRASALVSRVWHLESATNGEAR